MKVKGQRFIELLILWSIDTCKSAFSRSLLPFVKVFKVNSNLINRIWKNKSSKKVKLFLWFLAYRSLHTDDRMQHKFKNWYLSPLGCRLCVREAEDNDTFSYIVGLLIMLGWILLMSWGSPFAFPRTLMIGSWKAFMVETWRKLKLLVNSNCAFQALLWHIWRGRNTRRSDDKFSRSFSFNIFCVSCTKYSIVVHHFTYNFFLTTFRLCLFLVII